MNNIPNENNGSNAIVKQKENERRRWSEGEREREMKKEKKIIKE